MEATHELLGFKTIQLLSDQILGVGCYGAVRKAKCDDLVCAAKIIHPALLTDPSEQHNIESPEKCKERFRQECEFMRIVRHPNIVQYLGTCRDPKTGLPVLLMELMDDSLTHFLESSQEPLPYHTQLNFCHDIARAISYLHTNNISHGDVCSKNVLLIGDIRAKLTDFGLAKFIKSPSDESHNTFSKTLSIETLLPSEDSVEDCPRFPERRDCFAFGKLIIAILTRLPIKSVRTVNPGLSDGQIEVSVGEVEGQQIYHGGAEIKQSNALLPVALECLKEREVDRPSAQELCERLVTLKGTIT